MSDAKFVMKRQFSAPKNLVWRCWTEADLVQRWYGPGVETVIHEFSPKVGGLWLNEMRMQGNSMYQRMEYTEVTPMDRLAMLMSNTDGDWNVIDNPMMENWPRVLLTIVELTETPQGTEQTLIWEPHDASEAEREAFAQALPNLEGGWGKGMEIIDDILAELQG